MIISISWAVGTRKARVPTRMVGRVPAATICSAGPADTESHPGPLHRGGGTVRPYLVQSQGLHLSSFAARGEPVPTARAPPARRPAGGEHSRERTVLYRVCCAPRHPASPHRDRPPPHPRYPEITVQLTGEDGNAYAILGAVQRALRAAGVPAPVRTDFLNEATSGDYDHLLRTCMAWVDVA